MRKVPQIEKIQKVTNSFHKQNNQGRKEKLLNK